MSRNLVLVISIALSLFLSITTYCNANQFFDPFDGQLDASQYLSENAYGFLPIPIIITDPAVDGGLGMMGLFFHENEEDKDKRLEAMQTTENASMHLMPPSISALMGAYTGNDSYFIGGGHVGFFKQGKIRYMGGGGYGDVNLDFYGFGDIELKRPVTLNTNAKVIMQNLKFEISDSSFFIGPAQRYITADIMPANLNDYIDLIPPEWQEPITDLLTASIATSGLGVTMEYDSRDNFFSPKSGLRYQFNYLWYDEKFGSDVDYQLAEFSALHYFKLSSKWRAGFRLDFDYADTGGDLLPPYATPSISLRGVPAGRYQGNAIGVSEIEMIYALNFRWQINAFVGIGKTSNDFSDLLKDASKVSKGVGFRYLIARRYGFDVGLDIAKGPEDTVVYIQAGSAW